MNEGPVEAAIDPALPIVDPHQHYRDHANADRPFHRYLLPDFVDDAAGGHNIIATVAVESGAFYRARGPAELISVGETEFLAGIAAMAASERYMRTRAAAGIVSCVDLRLGTKVAAVLDAHVAAAGGRLRGIRAPMAWDPSPFFTDPRSMGARDLMTDSSFRSGLACLRPRHLSLDLWLFYRQLPALLDLASAFPDTIMILNHAGGPIGVGPYAGRRAEVFTEWCAHMTTLRPCANIFVKLGGLGMPVMGFGFDRQPVRQSSQALAEAWRPYIETCLAIFGVERCMFESNFPADKVTCDYTRLWNAFKRITADYSPAEKAALFSRTAARVYRLAAN